MDTHDDDDFLGPVPDQFLCPITHTPMTGPSEPVKTVDGHTYGRPAIETWLSTHDTSPMTNLRLENKALVACPGLKMEIEAWLQDHRGPTAYLRCAQEIVDAVAAALAPEDAVAGIQKLGRLLSCGGVEECFIARIDHLRGQLGSVVSMRRDDVATAFDTLRAQGEAHSEAMLTKARYLALWRVLQRTMRTGRYAKVRGWHQGEMCKDAEDLVEVARERVRKAEQVLRRRQEDTEAREDRVEKAEQTLRRREEGLRRAQEDAVVQAARMGVYERCAERLLSRELQFQANINALVEAMPEPARARQWTESTEEENRRWMVDLGSMCLRTGDMDLGQVLLEKAADCPGGNRTAWGICLLHGFNQTGTKDPELAKMALDSQWREKGCEVARSVIASLSSSPLQGK